MKAKKLTKELGMMIVYGAQMSNVCYNLSQMEYIPEHHRKIMKELCTNWDKACMDYIGPIKPLNKGKQK